MKWLCRKVVCSLAFAGFASAVLAVTPDLKDNPYKVVVDRNVFGLRPPPSNTPTNTEPPPPPAATVKITGITKVLGQTRVLLLVQEPASGGKPGPAAKEVSYILSPGQAKGPIEILEIVDEKEGKVRIKNSGSPLLLSFATHGVKLAPGSPPAAGPGVFNPNIPPPAAALGTPRIPAPGSGMSSMGSGNPNAFGGGAQPLQANPGLRQIPTRPVRTQMTPQQEADLATQYLMMEKYRHETEGRTDLPPLPPTPLSQPPQIPQ